MNKNRSILFLLIFFLSFSCARDVEANATKVVVTKEDNDSSRIDTVKPSSVTKNPEKIKIFIQNTGGMYGYFKGRSELKNEVRNILGQLNTELNAPINLKAINHKDINELGYSNPSDVYDLLKESELKPMSSGYDYTVLSSNFEEIIEDTGGEGISVFVTNGILSRKDGENASSSKFLADMQSAMRDVFKENKNLELNLYQFTGEFDGKYYDYKNRSRGLPDLKTSRPYYYFVMGDAELMKRFDKKMDDKIKKVEGFENSYKFSRRNYADDIAGKGKGIYTTVFTTTVDASTNNFKDGQDSNRKYKLINKTKKGTKHFSLALDLSGVPVSEEYKTTVGNYDWGPKSDFELKEIVEISDDEYEIKDKSIKLKGEDTKKAEKATHVFLFESNKQNLQDLEISLKKNTPEWVNETHTLDDKDIRDNPELHSKTFGFATIIEGLEEGFEHEKDNSDYFKLKLPIQNGSGGGTSPLWWILGIGGVIFLAVFIIKKKRDNN